MKTLLGKKVGMTQIFAEDGTVIPVTVIEAGPETVVQIKTVETDGYDMKTRSRRESTSRSQDTSLRPVLTPRSTLPSSSLKREQLTK